MHCKSTFAWAVAWATLISFGPVAQAAITKFEIPAQPLAASLRDVGRQANINVLVDPPLMGELQGPALKAEITAQEALTRLLAGTGLTHEFLTERTVVVAPTGSAGVFRLAQADKPNEAVTTPDRSGNSSRPDPIEEILVTGTRIKGSDAYDQPTPVTSLSAETLQDSAPSTIPDALFKMPQFTNSPSRSTCCNTGSSGNFLNLRGLSADGTASRTLVLLDGERIVPSREAGDVDVNLLPELLIERVDIVTGGASAVYGSDAVAGVVNYIVNNKFEGFRINLQSGISRYGDDNDVKYGIAAGRAFADGRAHVVASYEHYDSDGFDTGDRDYSRNGHFLAGNGTPSNPYYYTDGVRLATATSGGLISGGPLNGLVFGPGGATHSFVAGAPVPGASSSYQYGGDGVFYGDSSVLAQLSTDKLYTRLTYDVTDTLTAHVRLNAAQSSTFARQLDSSFRGSNAVTIFRENAFLPASVGAAMDTAGVTSFSLSRPFDGRNGNFNKVGNDYKNKSVDVNAGVEGSIGQGWTWQTSYARGVFTSVPDLKRKLMRYIRHYNKAPKTVKWKYFDPTRRITSQSVVTVH